MLLIGSNAIKINYPDFPREPKDVDYVVKDSSKFAKIKDTEFLENPILLEIQEGHIIDMDILLSLKISHMFWDNMWEKHLFDIQFLLKKGHKYDLNLINKFRAHWNEVLPKVRRSQLAMNKEDFFNNAVNEDSDEHDYLHTLINEIPMYTLLLKEGSEVELDEDNWHRMSFEQKCEVVREETYVMAWERYKDVDYRVAFKRQLKQNIIKHFPSYIALFAIENYIKLERPAINYKNVINSKLEYDKV